MITPSLVLLLGCPDPATPVPPTPPTPEDTGPFGDTGLPPAPEPEPVPLDIALSPPMLCPDAGRDVRFYDEIHIGPESIDARMWESSGLIIDDFDADGVLDILAPGRESTQLWQRTPTGWADRSSALLPGIVTTHAVGGSTADYDADGDPDVYLARYGEPDLLLRNDGGVFTDVTVEARIPNVGHRTASASWGDFDGDGWLDLFAGGYGEAPPSAWDTDMGPGDESLLLRNRGDGTFEDLSGIIPRSVHDSYTFQSAWYDVNADGYPELFVVQDFGWVRPSVVFWNRQGVLELDDGTALFHPNFAGMGLAVGDLNGDRMPDFVQSSYEDISLSVSQTSGFSTEGVAWAEFSDAMTLTIDPEDRNQIFGWGTEFGDLDNDRDLDLVMGFGKWDEYLNPEWQFDAVWVQDAGTFAQRGANPNYQANDRGSTRGVLLVDLDGDGWLDIVKRMLDEPLTVHRSRCSPNRHFLTVSLRDATTPNTRAIGARMTLYVAGEEMTRWVDAGSRSMFSGGPPQMHFGLGEELVVDRAEIVWPDGEVMLVDELPADRHVTLTRTQP